MTSSTKARPAAKPAAPKPGPKPAATPKAFDTVPETDAAPNSAKPDSKASDAPMPSGNSAYATETVRKQITAAMADLRTKGFTRPSISAVTGFTDSQVWRAQNDKVHTSEVPVLMDFIKQVVDGKVKPPENGLRKPKAADLQAKIDAALQAVAELDPKATVTALRKAVAEVKTALEA